MLFWSTWLVLVSVLLANNQPEVGFGLMLLAPVLAIIKLRSKAS
jgi:hypothetical protein